MTFPKLSFLPREIGGQIVLLVVLSAAIFHLCFMLALYVGHNYLHLRPPFDRGHERPFALRPPGISPRLAAGLTTQMAAPGFRFATGEAKPPLEFGPDGRPPPPFMAAGRLPPPHFPHGPPPLIPLEFDLVPMGLTTLLFIGISFTIFLIWAALAITRPLRKFAQAVDAFSADGTAARLEETGPRELCAAAHALNEMRDRVGLMIEQRTQMLAAISHDLRTPVTRLRLRAEFVEPQEVRDSILHDLEQMNAMIHSALSFIRDGIATQRNTLLDLGALLQTIRDEFTDLGFKVLFETPAPTLIKGSADELYRALTNLVSNAVKFGTEVEIQLRHAEQNRIQIDIVDDGPGIPSGSKAAMFAPFARGDEARTAEPLQGFGLGLPISRAIVMAHQGSLELLDRAPHGLIARVTLAA